MGDFFSCTADEFFFLYLCIFSLPWFCLILCVCCVIVSLELMKYAADLDLIFWLMALVLTNSSSLLFLLLLKHFVFCFSLCLFFFSLFLQKAITFNLNTSWSKFSCFASYVNYHVVQLVGRTGKIFGRKLDWILSRKDQRDIQAAMTKGKMPGNVTLYS